MGIVVHTMYPTWHCSQTSAREQGGLHIEDKDAKKYIWVSPLQVALQKHHEASSQCAILGGI